jgi:uncharacterized metal-binding protein
VYRLVRSVPFEEFPSKDGHLDIIVVQGLLLYSSIGVSTCVGTQANGMSPVVLDLRQQQQKTRKKREKRKLDVLFEN